MSDNLLGARATLTSVLAEFAATLRCDDLPPRVLRKAKVVLLDAGAMAVAGAAMPSSSHAVRYIEGFGPGRATVLAGGRRASPEFAALVNSVLMHALLQDDAHFESWSHPGTVVIPAALAGAEMSGSDGPDLVAAIVVGYDVMARIGAVGAAEAIQRGFRATPLIGAFGAAAAYGRLRGVSTEALQSAFGLAANFACGLLEPVESGHPEWRFQVALATRNGIAAVDLAEAGVRASPTALEGAKGFYESYCGSVPEPAPVLERLGEWFRILEVKHKAYASAGVNQNCISLTRALMRRHLHLRVEQIRSIDIAVKDEARRYPGGEQRGPFATVEAALSSKPFAVAATIVDEGRPLLIGSILCQLRNPAVAGLCERVTLSSIPEGEHPNLDSVRMRFTLNNGLVFEGDQRLCNPQDAEPDWCTMVDKFKMMAGPQLGDRASNAVVCVAEVERRSAQDIVDAFVFKAT